MHLIVTYCSQLDESQRFVKTFRKLHNRIFIEYKDKLFDELKNYTSLVFDSNGDIHRYRFTLLDDIDDPDPIEFIRLKKGK